MMNLWLGLAVLVAVALLFIWLPLLLGSKDDKEAAADRTAQNVAIFKQRMAELEQELAENTLEQQSYNDLKAELEANLLDEVEDADEIASKKPSFPFLYPVLLTLLMPIAAIGFYQYNGFSESLAVAVQQGPVAAPQNITADKAALENIRQLTAQLETDPENPEVWFLLARTFINMERYQEAYDALAVVSRLVGDHPGILSQQAQALYYLNQSQMTTEATQLLTRAQELDPQDPNMLAFAGIVAFDRTEFPQAIQLWKMALSSDKPGINREALTVAIQRAEAEMASRGQTTETVPVITAPASSPIVADGNNIASAGVEVMLSLDSALLKKVTAETTVFIVAQAVNGPQMPLAAKRMTVADLPKTILLDDASAMSPMARLSLVPEVKIKAIVSFSGSAGASPGDFIGQSEVVSINAGKVQQIELIIDQTVE